MNHAEEATNVQLDSQAAVWRQSRKRLLPATVIGTALEFYDALIYAQAAALVFGVLFFPEFSATAGVLLGFATFGAGYVARPLGAFIFGHIGDKYGRKTSLVATLLLMGVSTMLIGILPTYAMAGVAAPLLLVILRLFQGLGSASGFMCVCAHSSLPCSQKWSNGGQRKVFRP